MDSDFLKKIIESNKKVIETKLKNAKRIEESNNTLLELNSGKIITPIITKKEDELTIDDSHISPPEKFNNYIKKNFGIQGKWRIEGKGLNIFYNSQPQTLDAMKKSFEVKNFYNNYSSILYIKQDTRPEGDSRYILCLTTPDRSEGVSYRNTYGFQPGYFDNTDPNSLALTIQDYDDNGWYTLRDFERDENGKIKKIRGYYREAGYDARNRYQVPTTGAIELTWLTDETELDFIDGSTDTTDNLITRNKPKQSVLDSMKNDIDIWWYKQDYFYDFKAISSSRYDQTTTFPIINKDFKIVGEGFGLFKYTLDKGQTTCVSQFRFTFFNEIYDYDDLRNYSIESFTIPVDATVKSKYVSSTYFFAPNYKNQHIIDNYDVTWKRVDDNVDLYSMEFIEPENNLIKNFGPKNINFPSIPVGVKAKSDGITMWSPESANSVINLDLINGSQNNDELLTNLIQQINDILIENTKYYSNLKSFIVPGLILKEENNIDELIEQVYFVSAKINDIYLRLQRYFEKSSNNNVFSSLLSGGLTLENSRELKKVIKNIDFEIKYSSSSIKFSIFKDQIITDLDYIGTLFNEIEQDIDILNQIQSSYSININGFRIVNEVISSKQNTNTNFKKWINSIIKISTEWSISEFPNTSYSYYFSFLLSNWLQNSPNGKLFNSNLSIIFINGLFSDTYF